MTYSYKWFLLSIKLLLSTMPLFANEVTITPMGWSSDGKLALAIIHPNPRDGYDASYFIVDLIDDIILAQFDEMAETDQKALVRLESRWWSPMQQLMKNHKIQPVETQEQLPQSFEAYKRNYQLLLQPNQLILMHNQKKKVILSPVHTSAQLLNVYLSPHEARIAIILKVHDQIFIYGSNLLVGF
ncbi:hypothetical protein PVA44_06475 [Entomospira nematocerorum]|uniref:Uncharacterized protein n=1 Tax=Entomospira nematocerorum TaxID=2719987 RepID=A0A968GAP6_9SPIO|nr:hypothetical protein [Entomospira nematocera]NIZ46334.1 hypothetical protein [Entomospira nematocera]WDI33862.1 hypothetical protein PVA44_06475 [Entomospira nematocera]